MRSFRAYVIFFLALFCASRVIADDAQYHFVGNHFVASFLGCDVAALTDVAALEQVMLDATRASGAKVLSSDKYIFPGNGFTMAVLLSESHASIHTYPELGACFIDLFTCGHNCSAKNFSTVLEEYLKPTQVNKKMLLRDTDVQVFE